MYDTGAAHRMVVTLTKSGPKAVSSLPGSTTGNPLNPDYLDLLEAWLLNDTHDLLTDPADDAGNKVEHFVPND